MFSFGKEKSNNCAHSLSNHLCCHSRFWSGCSETSYRFSSSYHKVQACSFKLSLTFWFVCRCASHDDMLCQQSSHPSYKLSPPQWLWNIAGKSLAQIILPIAPSTALAVKAMTVPAFSPPRLLIFSVASSPLWPAFGYPLKWWINLHNSQQIQRPQLHFQLPKNLYILTFGVPFWSPTGWCYCLQRPIFSIREISLRIRNFRFLTTEREAPLHPASNSLPQTLIYLL